MENLLIGAGITAALAVMGWLATTAMSKPRTYLAVRPFALVTFGQLVFLGCGLFIGTIAPSIKWAAIVLIAGAGGMMGVLLINLLAQAVHQQRRDGD